MLLEVFVGLLIVFILPGVPEHPGDVGKDCLSSVSPLVEAEMMRIGNVLSGFGESPSEAPFAPHQTPQRVTTCKKRESSRLIFKKESY